MKKNIFIVILLLLNVLAFAENKISVFDDFIDLNNALIHNSLYMEQVLLTYDQNHKKLDQLDAVSFFSKGSQLTQFDDSYFLGTAYGYWIMNNRMKTPLKVSGNYQVQEIQIQDILRIDFEKDYAIEKYENGIIYLSRVNKKAAYPFLELSKVAESEYQIMFNDKNKKNIKKAIYKKGSVSGYNCFFEIEIYNLVFNTDTYFKYSTNLIQEIKLPDALFSQNQMYNLINYIKQNRLVK